MVSFRLAKGTTNTTPSKDKHSSPPKLCCYYGDQFGSNESLHSSPPTRLSRLYNPVRRLRVGKSKAITITTPTDQSLETLCIQESRNTRNGTPRTSIDATRALLTSSSRSQGGYDSDAQSIDQNGLIEDLQDSRASEEAGSSQRSQRLIYSSSHYTDNDYDDDPSFASTSIPSSRGRVHYDLDCSNPFTVSDVCDSEIGTATLEAKNDGTADPLDDRPSLDSLYPRLSMSRDHDEAALLWEKALLAHREQTKQTRHSPDYKKPPSVQERGRTPSPRSTYELIDMRTSTGSKPRAASIFKPLETEHTFDRLPVPSATDSRGRRSSFHEDPSISLQPPDCNMLNISKQGLRRSSSHPPRAAGFASSPTHRHNPPGSLLLPEEAAPVSVRKSMHWLALARSQSNVSAAPSVHTSMYDDASRARSQCPSPTWSQYPSHTRSERSLSAGLADGVIARDFAPVLPSRRSEDTSSLNSRDGARRRSAWARARSVKLKKALLTDLPEKFRPRALVGFRKAEGGHRSSISVGGVLEYPELELIPARGLGDWPQSC